MRLALFGLAAVLAGSCASASPTIAPAPPSPPLGWSVLAAWSGEAPGRTSVEVAVDEHAVAVDATCDGTGTLIVIASPASSAGAAATWPSATFPCTDDRTATQLSLDRVAPGRVMFTAYLVEGFGATRPSRFAVSVERAD